MVNPILIGSVLGSTVAYLKKIGKIPYSLEEALEILMGHPIGDDVNWDNKEDDDLGDEVTWNAAPQQTKVKFPRAKADKIVKKVEKHLKPYVVDMMACGSYRRGAQMIGDIDFVLILKPEYELPEILPANEGINWVGNQKAQVIIDGEKVDFRVTTPDAWGATILYFTGPADFNIKYRWMAKKRGFKLSEYGLFDRKTDKYIAGKTENDIFTALGRPYKNPDVRKGFRAEYQPNQSLEDYSHQDLMTSSVVTGDFTTDSLKYGFGPTALSAEDNYEATYGKEQAKIRRRLKKSIKARNTHGTKAGQWSARKSQLLKQEYEAACEKRGLRAYKGDKTQKQQNLTDWSRQKWGTASGKKSSKTGEPYFPEKAIEALKDRGLYAKAKRQKQAATKAGKQHARYSDDIREVVKPFRSEEKFYYHGTDMRNLDTILSEGIKPTDVENTVWYEELEDISPHPYYYEEVDDFLPSVFVAETPEEAQWWSEEAGNTEIVVLKISPQVENLANFSDDGVGGWRTSETIPNNYIVDIISSETFEAESFVTLDIKDMDRFLRNRRFKPVDIVYRNRPVKEWVYERALPGRPNHVVRVYTSINRYGHQKGRGRDVGRDAIRVQVVYQDNQGETLVSAPTRVHRIGTWETNLDKRLLAIATEKPQVMFDSRGEPMTLRKNKGKLFWGSRDYPKYKETRRYESEQEILIGKPGEVAWRAMNPHDYALGLAEGSISKERTMQGVFHAVTKLPNYMITNWKGFPLFEIDIEGLKYEKRGSGLFPNHIVIIEDIPIERVMPLDSDLGMDRVTSYQLTEEGKPNYGTGWSGPQIMRDWKEGWSERFYSAESDQSSVKIQEDAPEGWKVVTVSDYDNNFYRAYQMVIEVQDYNQVWSIVELIDDVNLLLNKVPETRFKEDRVVITVYTSGEGITSKDDYWCEEFNEVLETL